MMEWLNELASWAWARHHNELSWYIRPLFLLPFGYFSYRRNGWGIALTLVALATSMAWFPAPEHPTPGAIQFLADEREYLLGEWGLAKIAMALLVPLMLVSLGTALWRRSLVWALVVINAGGIFKIVWSFALSDTESAMRLFYPAAAGLVVLNAVLLFMWRRRRVVRVVPSAHAGSTG